MVRIVRSCDDSARSARWRRRFRVLRLVAGIATVVALATIVFRRRLLELVARATPYVRREVRLSAPALIVNRWSGGGKAEQYGLAEAAREAGIRVIMLERGDDIVQLARDAVDDGADAIGAAGGDGSLGLVADVAMERDVAFFCLPMGTRNHFALDLGLDRDNPLSALDAIRDGEELLIDVGVAGGRPFLNNVSFGIYAEAVHRDEYRDNKEQTVASVIREFGEGEDEGGATALRFSGPRGGKAERVAMALVSNNPYVFSGPPDYGRRLRLDAGRLGISAAGEGTAADGTAGRAMRHWEDDALRLESDGPILAGLDGEAVEFESPLDLSIRPRALRVLVPRGTRPGFVRPRDRVEAGLVGLARLAGVPGRDDGD
jgi:diacylglycerol kinase family enzyme